MSGQSAKSPGRERIAPKPAAANAPPARAPQAPAAPSLQRALANPAEASPGELLALQRTAGNRAVSRLAAGTPAARRGARIQPKLTVGPAGDQYEQEADRTAAEVMRMPEPEPGGPSRAAVQRSAEPEESLQLSRADSSAGFEAGAEVEGQLAASKGGGSPLPGATRSFMEPRFGADFSQVRVHTGPQAARLNRSVQAQAFTHRSHIYFGSGKYQPGTGAGNHLLAHELTHVVQQGGAGVQTKRADKRNKPGPAVQRLPSVSLARERVQRLSFDNTQWNQATKAHVSTGGGVGVLFVEDNSADPPVVVKSGEGAPAETALFAALHQQAGEDAGGDWGLTSPGSRVVGPDEGAEIKAAVTPLLPGDNRRAKRIVDALEEPGTMVFQYAQGTEFKKLVGDPTSKKHSKKKFLSKRKVRKDSPFRLFKDPGFVTALGRATAVDVFTGNYDRLLIFNPENFMVDNLSKTVALIDNVYTSDDFVFNKVMTRIGEMTGDEGYKSWTANNNVKNLAQNNYSFYSNKVVESISDSLRGSMKVRNKDLGAVSRMLRRGRVKRWFEQGLALGKASLAAIIGRGSGQLVGGIAQEDRQGIWAAVQKRLAFLLTGVRDLTPLHGPQQQGGVPQPNAPQVGGGNLPQIPLGGMPPLPMPPQVGGGNLPQIPLGGMPPLPMPPQMGGNELVLPEEPDESDENPGFKLL